ncbi:hypothetical protein OA087_01445 [bacterium]|nr:hypothetical protein [bacterium]
MKKNTDIKDLETNIISFKKYQNKKKDQITSTIAAIIAIKIDHPKYSSPEEYFLDHIDLNNNIEILAFEDALENQDIGLTTKDAQIEASNDA